MTTLSHNHALLIGVGADLPNTVTDAEGLAQVLSDATRCAYDPTKVVLLTEKQATRTLILSQLDTLAQQSTPDSTVLVYFSGHGYVTKSAVGKHYFLMPFGYQLADLSETAISGKEFTDKLAAIPAQRLLLLLDCCHAQGIGEAKAAGMTLSKAPLPPEAAQLFAQGSGRIIITSSKAEEVSFTGNPYSLFTRSLIDCLCGADVVEGDGYVRALDLAMYASRKVSEWSQDRQHPVADTQRADNFVVAYYAAGAKSPLPSKLPAINPAVVAADVDRQVAALTQTVTQQGKVNINLGGTGNQVSFGDVSGGDIIKGNTGNVTKVAGNQTNVTGDYVAGDKFTGDKVMGDKFTGDKIDASGSQGFVNRPTGPVNQNFGSKIDTGGGAYIGGNVNTGGGRFVGRDDFSVNTTTTTQGASVADFTALLKQIQQMVNAVPLGEDERAEIATSLATVTTQAGAAQPKPTIITGKLKYVKELIEGATGVGVAATGLATVVQKAIEMVGQVFR